MFQVCPSSEYSFVTESALNVADTFTLPLVTVVTSAHPDKQGNPHPKISSVDIVKFNAQYQTLTVKYSEKFHDRFLILDDQELYLIGASLKDLGKKCFGFTKMDAGEIAGIKARI